MIYPLPLGGIYALANQISSSRVFRPSPIAMEMPIAPCVETVMWLLAMVVCCSVSPTVRPRSSEIALWPEAVLEIVLPTISRWSQVFPVATAGLVGVNSGSPLIGASMMPASG